MSDGGLIDFDSLPAAGPQAVSKSKEKKQEEVQKDEGSKTVEHQFLQIFDDLLLLVSEAEDFNRKEFVHFLLVFRSIFSKDFFSDEMASTLLREIYFETEEIDEAALQQLEAKRNKNQPEETQVVRRLADHEIYAQMYGEKDDGLTTAAYQQGKGNLNALGKWDSRKCSLALYTVNQDVILDELKERFDLESNASWEVVRNLCLPVWIKDSYKLRLVADWISKVAYKVAAEE